MHETKQRLVGAAAELLNQQGYNGTAVKQIVERAGAPFASMYHFFPGGKEELGADAVRWSGRQYGELADLFFVGGDVVAETRAFFRAAADTVRGSGYVEGCPIATVALEVAGVNEVLRQATADVFEAWIAALAGRYEAGGVEPEDARPLAASVLALLEGGFVFARAMRDESHLVAAGDTAALAVDDARRRGRRPRPRWACTASARSVTACSASPFVL